MAGCGTYTCNSSTHKVGEGHESEFETNLSYMVRAYLFKNRQDKKEKKNMNTDM